MNPFNQPPSSAVHWDEVYRTKAADQVSWYQPAADASLRLVTTSPVTAGNNDEPAVTGPSSTSEQALQHWSMDCWTPDTATSPHWTSPRKPWQSPVDDWETAPTGSRSSSATCSPGVPTAATTRGTTAPSCTSSPLPPTAPATSDSPRTPSHRAESSSSPDSHPTVPRTARVSRPHNGPPSSSPTSSPTTSPSSTPRPRHTTPPPAPSRPSPGSGYDGPLTTRDSPIRTTDHQHSRPSTLEGTS